MIGFRYFKRTIGIVGLAGAGKTVTLTSLLSHLKDHEPEELVVSPKKPNFLIRKLTNRPVDSVILKRFRPLSADLPSDVFNYERHRDALINHGKWPEKTKDQVHYRVRFERSDWKRAVDFTFIDFPGERIADAIMGSDNFDHWSDAILKQIEDDTEYRSLSKDYLSLQDGREVSQEKLVSEYKKTLSRFLLNYKPMISPSVFSLDQSGQAPSRGETPENMAQSRLVGLSEETQFAPLGPKCREANQQIYERFKKYYQDYRSEVPDKVFHQLQACDSLIVAIDIPGTLAANVGRLNDTEAILSELLRICNPDRSVKETFARVGKYALFGLAFPFVPDNWLPKRIRRIAFIATKADLVPFDQISNMETLLKQVVEKRVRDYDVEKLFLACSSITSTMSHKGVLYGYPMYDTKARLIPPPEDSDAPMTAIHPDNLPEEWPECWQEKIYHYPSVWPRMPKRKTKPPEQEGLNLLLDFLFEEADMGLKNG